MSKTKKNSNKAIGQNENYNMNNRSILSAQPITLNLIDSHHHMNINNNNGNTNGNHNHYNNSQETIKVGSAKKNKKIDKSQISGPTGFRVVQHVGLTNNNFEVSFAL
jgi:hypothetical protein